MAAVLLVGCATSDGESEVDAAVKSCHASARDACERIGYSNNETCLLAFAQDCSPEDEAAASAVCRAADGLPPGAECRLTWR